MKCCDFFQCMKEATPIVDSKLSAIKIYLSSKGKEQEQEIFQYAQNSQKENENYEINSNKKKVEYFTFCKNLGEIIAVLKESNDEQDYIRFDIMFTNNKRCTITLHHKNVMKMNIKNDTQKQPETDLKRIREQIRILLNSLYDYYNKGYNVDNEDERYKNELLYRMTIFSFLVKATDCYFDKEPSKRATESQQIDIFRKVLQEIYDFCQEGKKYRCSKNIRDKEIDMYNEEKIWFDISNIIINMEKTNDNKRPANTLHDNHTQIVSPPIAVNK